MPANRQKSKSDEPFIEQKSKSRRWLFPLFVGLLASVFFFLPTIVVHSPLKQKLLGMVAADIQGSVEIQNISVGWFSPITLENVRVFDSDQQESITLESLTTSNTLIGFITGSELGTIQLIRPTLDLQLRDDGSNLEDIFSKYINSPTESQTTELPKIKLQVVDGTVRLRSIHLTHPTMVHKLNAKITTLDSESPLSGEIQFECSSDDSNVGKMATQFTTDSGAEVFMGETFLAAVQTEQMSLDALAPLLTRVVGRATCTGIVNSEFELSLNAKQQSVGANFQSFQAGKVAFLAPSIFGQDQFVAKTLSAAGKIELSTHSATANQFKAETEFARFQADGDFDFQQLADLGAGKQLPTEQFHLDGVIDLAQVTAMLPETTHIREGVAMKSGILKLTAGTRNENGSPRLVLNTEAANVNFTLDGNPISWNQPLRAVAVAGKTNGQFQLHDVELQSDFLSMKGNVALDSGQLQINGDLKKVTDQLGQILDLGGLQLGGVASGSLVWDIDPEHDTNDKTLPVQLTGRLKVLNPVCHLPGMKLWKESSINLDLNGSCKANTETGVIGVDKAKAVVAIGNEKLDAQLALPIANVATDWKYQFNCNATGSIAKWISQAQNFTEIPKFYSDGQLDSRFLLTLNDQTFRINQLQFQAKDFVFDGFALQIREPTVSGRVNLKYQYNDGSLLFTKSKITSPSLAVSTDELKLLTEKKLLADGAMTFRGNANRASQWIGLSMPGDSVRWDGLVNGTMTFQSASNQFGGRLSAKVKQLVFVQPVSSTSAAGATVQAVSQQQSFEEFWNEPEARLVANLELSDDFNTLNLNNTTINSKTTDLQLSGSIGELATVMNANLKGRWNVNWSEVNNTIKEMAGDVIAFQGQGWQPIQIRGPLYDANGNYAWIPNQLGGGATVQWQQASLLGVDLGASKVDVRLKQSFAKFNSQNNSSFMGQIFQMQPIMDLRQAEPVVYLQKGKLLDHWNVSVEDSRTWLKYAAPLIADATAAKGAISADLQGAAIPLFDPMQSSAQGELVVHDVQVGPGPLAQQLIPMIDQLKKLVTPDGSALSDRVSWFQLEPQKIPFVVQDGRVFHEGFKMSYKDLIVSTRGSVGFDQSLNLVAEIPISDQWLKGDRLQKGLSGKKISIPIYGTLAKPQLDRRSVAQFTQQLLKDATVGVVNEKINREVEQLQQKVGGKVTDELNQFQDKLNDKFKTGLEDKVQNELRNGLNKLFGGDKKQ